jgi:hypothetical protein
VNWRIGFSPNDVTGNFIVSSQSSRNLAADGNSYQREDDNKMDAEAAEKKEEQRVRLAIDTLRAIWRKQVVGGWEPPLHVLDVAVRTYGYRICLSAINQTAGKYERENGNMGGFHLEQYFSRSCLSYAEKRNAKERHIPTRQYGYDDDGNLLS